MNKLFFTLILTLSAGLAEAQLKVDSLGRTRMGSGPIEYSQFQISSASVSGVLDFKNSLYLQNMGRPSASNDTRAALYAKGLGYKAGTMFGVKSVSTVTGTSTGTQYGYRIAVCGIASSGLDGQNYGVIGVSATHNGAGIYGTTVGGYTTVTTQTLDRKYAGYFRGQTKVEGDFEVTGNISGTLLTPSSNPTPSTVARTSLSNRVVSNQLEGLTANSFYYDTPNELKSATISLEDENISHSMSGEHNSVEDNTQTTMERQVYAKQHYSLSADELEEIFPDLVYENEDGSKSINYVEMVPILVQAIGELKSEINELKGNGAAKKVAAKATGMDAVKESDSPASLAQNKPNPFVSSTDIEVIVPESVQSAFVYVYDLQGKKVQQVNITARGKQTVQLDAADLSDGMYLYSLITDGKVVDTRRMIVEK